MFIQTEDTPNPQVIKFIPGKTVMLNGTLEITTRDQAQVVPLALHIMSIPGVTGLFFSTDFISVTKNDKDEWSIIKPQVLAMIMEHYLFHDCIDIKDNSTKTQANEDENDPIVAEIKEIINSRVRPAVAQDGGDIIFDHFKDGIVYVKLQGACSGCPSSSDTLKSGIENMLRHYVPEVQMVEAI